MNYVQKLASHLTLADDLSPDSRDREYKGRIKQCFSQFMFKPVKSMGVSFMAALFFAPMLAVFIFLMQKDLNELMATFNIYNEMGLMYSATSADVLNANIKAVFDLKQQYMLIYFIPGMMLGGIGMSGAFNCARNILWNTNPKLFRDFFVGIKRHWYKYLISWTILAVEILGFVWALLEILEGHYTGLGASPWAWVLIIASGLIGLITIMYYIVLQGMFVTHKYAPKAGENLKHTLKNSAILALINPLQILLLVIVLAAPFALCFIDIIGEVVYVCAALGGLCLYPIINIQYSLYLSDNFTYYLYSHQVAKEKKKEDKKSKNKKKK